VKGDGSKYYKDGESFGNNTNAKAAFMLASGAVLPDGTLPPEMDALLRQMNNDALEAGQVSPSSIDDELPELEPSSQTAGGFDRLSPSLSTAGAGASSVQHVRDLCNLGYDRAHVVHCLTATDFDVDDAMRMLMTNFLPGVEGPATLTYAPPSACPVAAAPEPEPEMPLPGSATQENHVAASAAPVDLNNSLPTWFSVALNVAAIAIIVMAVWARIQTPLLAWWLTNNTTPVTLAIAFAPTATKTPLVSQVLISE